MAPFWIGCDSGYEKAKTVLNKKYGITFEIIRQHCRDTIDLLFIKNTNVGHIHNFYRKLSVSVNSFKTLNKLETAEILIMKLSTNLVLLKLMLLQWIQNGKRGILNN